MVQLCRVSWFSAVYYSGPTSKSRISCCLHNLIICILVLCSQRKTNAFQFQKRVSIPKSNTTNILTTGFSFSDDFFSYFHTDNKTKTNIFPWSVKFLYTSLYMYLVWPYDSELFPQNFVWQLNNDQKSLNLYYECLK